MKVTEDVRKYAAEQAISEDEALKKGMEEKSKEFVSQGAEVQGLKSKDSSRREASGEDVCVANGQRPRLREQPSQFVEQGAEVYAKA
jgi:hypothetical protein